MTSGTKAYFFEQDRGNRNVFKRVRQVHKKHHRRKKRERCNLSFSNEARKMQQNYTVRHSRRNKGIFN